MNRYDKLREDIIQICKDKSACQPEFKKLISAKNENDFLQVLLNNFEWCMKNKVLNTS